MKYRCLGKYGPYPAAGGASSGHLLFQEGKALALDMGSGTLPRLLASVKGHEVCGVVLTHLHPDHYSDLLVYAQYLAKCAERPMPLYLPRTPDRVSSLLADTGVFDVRFTDAESTAQCGPFALRFAPTVHPLPGYAVRVEGDASFAYTGDSLATHALVAWAKQADILLCDVPCTEETAPSPSPHMTAEQAGALARNAQVGALWISHLVPGSDEQAVLHAARKIFQESSLVEEMTDRSV